MEPVDEGTRKPGEGAAESAAPMEPPVAMPRQRWWLWPAAITMAVVSLIVGLFAGSYRLAHQAEYYYRFDRGKAVREWSPMGTPEGAVAFAQDEEVPSLGRGCLTYTYEAVKDQFTGVATWLPTLKYLDRIELWVKSGEKRDLVIGLEQEDGASFLCYVPAEKGAWRYVSVGPRNFFHNEATASVAPELDVARVMNKLFVADVSGLRGTYGPNTISLGSLKVTRARP